MNDKLFWVIIILVIAIIFSLVFGNPREEELEPIVVVKPEPIVEKIIEEPIEVVEISEGKTENIEELKHLKRNELLEWNYTYLQNYTNVDCYARCKDGFCEVIKTFCSTNETLELEELIKIV